MTSLIIHGHFYQPPRENPWTGIVDAEPTATPFHDWNERIHAECYAPNSAVRMIDKSGAEQIVNNYQHISFNFGPTLLAWLERAHPETYASILRADAESVRRHDGHGNAIAQAYGHAILPLCNERDRRTHVRWGLADFRRRFNRVAESIWLPETACNDDVLNLLIDEEVRYVILAPPQAARVRSTADSEWGAVSEGKLDTSVPYRYPHSDGSGRSLAVFFYDPGLAHSIAFGDALKSSDRLIAEVARASNGSRHLVSVATDGETYGHHHKFGELCLAYALQIDAPAAGFTITNYGEYLDEHPPTVEVELGKGDQGEGTSWSCVHGVSRWIRDCGCQTGGEPNWNQQWRGPLRNALDYLRDFAAPYFEATRGELFADPWAARDDSVNLSNSDEDFFARHAPHPLTEQQRGEALLYLQMQRMLLLMYASCGWFFNDISGIEPVQILKYAARAIEIMVQLNLPSPRRQFLEILAEAKSNRPEMGNGADIYVRLVESSNPAVRAATKEPASVLV